MTAMLTYSFLRFLLLTYSIIAAKAMYSKRSLGEDYHKAESSKRLRTNLASLFCENIVSGARSQTLFADAQAAGAQHVKDLQTSQDKNIHRNLLRKLAKTKAKSWPKLYYAKVRVWSPKSQSIVWTNVPFLLPHELVAHLLEQSSPHKLANQAGMSADTRKHMADVSVKFQCPLIGVGLWCDGVPCNWDRSKSVEVLTMFLPGLEGQHAAMRFPITALPKNFVHKDCTYEDIFKIIVWSMEALGAGTWPSVRHDQQTWSLSDKAREKKAGQALGISGVLCEVRGDWSMYSSIFKLGGWSKKKHCCWKCDCNRDDMFDFTQSAPWRSKRMSHMDMLIRWKLEGVEPSSIFSCPFFHTGLFKIDWLHTMDLGCAADWIGNLFNYILHKLPGTTRKAQCSQLFLQIQAYYKAHPEVPGRYDNLTTSMIKNGKKGCKLRGKAAEVRGLVGFSTELAVTCLSRENALEATILQGTLLLGSCYDCLSHTTQRQSLVAACRKFCLLWKALEERSPGKLWKVKPKAHLLCELAEYTSDRPSDTWCYREEEFGGSLAQLSRIKGGKITPGIVARNVLVKFICQHHLPTV
jgi:hypothetical protein